MALLDPDEAMARIRAVCDNTGSEQLAPADAVGRVLMHDVSAPGDLPPFHNSAMDGFALGGGDTPLNAGSEYPIAGEQAAGDVAREADGGAWAIMTGARLPEGLDRVVPLERTERLEAPARVRLQADVPRGDNVRPAGSDVAGDATVLRAGTVLGPQHLMLLTALGVARVEVAVRPQVAVLATGRELVDDPEQALASGEIRNSNRPFLTERVPRAGAELVHAATVGDAREPFLAAVAQAREAGARVLVSTGAVSMGRHDFIPEALHELGAETLFHKLAIRPGKPLLGARLPDGTLFFGLPGNPIAAAVGLRFFVEPALRAMQALPPEQPLRVPLADAFHPHKPLRYHLKARLGCDPYGTLRVHVLPGQQSYRIAPLAQSNAWGVVPINSGDLAAGNRIDVYGPGHLSPAAIDGSVS